MMASEIRPGQWVHVKVTGWPRSAGAAKTMARLFEKDEQLRNHRKRQKHARVPRSHIRGGRPWYARPSRLQNAELTPGATYKLFASVDVLRDLGSVERYVEVSPA